jgi:hypothetical protein
VTASHNDEPDRRRRGGDLVPLREIRPGPPGTDLSRLWAARAAWREAAGEELSRRLVLLRAEGKAWVISVPSAAWAAELERLEGELLARLASFPAAGPVTRLQGVVRSAAGSGQPAGRRHSTRRAPEVAGRAAGEARERLEQLARRLLADGSPQGEGS